MTSHAFDVFVAGRYEGAAAHLRAASAATIATTAAAAAAAGGCSAGQLLGEFH